MTMDVERMNLIKLFWCCLWSERNTNIQIAIFVTDKIKLISLK
jgi:hypothetical protein